MHADPLARPEKPAAIIADDAHQRFVPHAINTAEHPVHKCRPAHVTQNVRQQIQGPVIFATRQAG